MYSADCYGKAYFSIFTVKVAFVFYIFIYIAVLGDICNWTRPSSKDILLAVCV